MHLAWVVVVFFFLSSRAAGFLIPKVPPQPPRIKDGVAGALMSSYAIKAQELSLKDQQQLTTVLSDASPIFVPAPPQPHPLLLEQPQYQTTATSTAAAASDQRSSTTALGTIMCLAVVATLAATDATGYNLKEFLPNVVDAMIPTSVDDTLAWVLGEAAGLALVAMCSVLLRLSSHPIGSDREHHDWLCPAEVFSDVVMWLEFAVLEDYSGAVWPSNAGLELALFGSICGASSLVYADIMSMAFGMGSTSRREIVLSRKWSDWIRAYVFRCISSITLFGVFDHVEKMLGG